MENQPTEDKIIHDDSFTVEKQRWGTYTSVGTDGRRLVTSLTEESCIQATRFYLKGLQEGWGDSNTSKSYEGVVGGKL